jgi:hypothetical protein
MPADMPSGSAAKGAHNSTGRNPYTPRAPSARARMTNGTRGAVLPGIDQRSAVALGKWSSVQVARLLEAASPFGASASVAA